MSREIYRQFRQSKGFSDYTDAGTNHPEADATCWWCYRPVNRDLHDFKACHEGMFYTVTHYHRKPKSEPPPDTHPRLFGEAG